MKDTIKKIFPWVNRANEPKQLAIVIVVYLIAAIIAGVILGLLTKLPIVGFVFGFVGSLVGLWSLVGIILAILVFLKVVEL